jgi:hypothetical protein
VGELACGARVDVMEVAVPKVLVVAALIIASSPGAMAKDFPDWCVGACRTSPPIYTIPATTGLTADQSSLPDSEMEKRCPGICSARSMHWNGHYSMSSTGTVERRYPRMLCYCLK